jgi:serine/threonine protein kinase
MSTWVDIPDRIGPYVIGHVLGSGTFALVKEAEDLTTSTKYAIKIVPKRSIGAVPLEQFEREVRLLLDLRHPGVVQLRDLCADSLYFYLVMELISGRTIPSTSAGTVNEGGSKPICKQILEVVAYLHSRSVAHRDLKLENILLDNTTHRIKLIDFGFSRIARAGELFQTKCGSLPYTAPEVIEGKTYDGMAADMWSCGVILYCLVTGAFPWKSATNEQQLLGEMTHGTFSIPDGVGKVCADLIRRLLVVAPHERLSAAEALEHPWFDGVAVPWGNAGRMASVVSDQTIKRLFVKEQTILPPRAQSYVPRMQRFAGMVTFRVNQRGGTSARVESPPSEVAPSPGPFTSRPPA